MAQFVVTQKMSACGSAAGIDPQTAAATVNLRGAVQKSTHFLFKQARKTIAARHASGNPKQSTRFCSLMEPNDKARTGIQTLNKTSA